jgi:DNA-directed RNA polymerase subunit RPC12/RpoP
MDIIFECSNCGQELEVDESAAGSELQCPSCSADITVPDSSSKTKSDESSAGKAAIPAPTPTPQAKEPPKKFSVPFSSEPTKELIKKPQKPLEVAAKEDERMLRVKTIRRADCKELEKDNFDQVVSEFFQQVGEEHIISSHPVTYSSVDSVSQKLVTDYGILILYRG